MLTPSLRNLALGSVFLATVVAGCAKSGKQNNAVIGLPTIQFPEPSFDFGQVTEGRKLTHVFAVKNVGAGVLHIDQVRPSCGCTAAVLKNKDIAPGGEGQIEVTFDTSHRGGDNHKTITVTSNDPVKPSANLEFHANVQFLLAFDPEFIQLRSEPGKPQSMETWLKGTLMSQARLKLVEKPADPALAVKVIEKTIEGGHAVQGLKFTVSTKTSGFHNANVAIETGVPNPDKLQLGYSWTVTGNYEVSQSELFFSDGKGDSRERVLRVTGKSPEFKLRRARIVSGPFLAHFDAPDSGVGYEVRVSLKKDAIFPASAVAEMGKLELVTNDSLEPRREITIKFTSSFVSAESRRSE